MIISSMCILLIISVHHQYSGPGYKVCSFGPRQLYLGAIKPLLALQVRKLQEEHDWLQEQIEPGSMDKQKTELDVPMLLPSRPPVRHLSL